MLWSQTEVYDAALTMEYYLLVALGLKSLDIPAV